MIICKFLVLITGWIMSSPLLYLSAPYLAHSVNTENESIVLVMKSYIWL